MALLLLLAGCGSEKVNPSPSGSGGSTSAGGFTGSGETGGTAGAGGAAGSGETGTFTPIRTVEERNPYGNVAATDNLLWDGDFEWTSPFSDQYGWLYGPPYSYTFPGATIGADCRSGVKCMTLPKSKGIIGIGVGSQASALAVTVFAKPKKGGCAGVEVSLVKITNLAPDAKIGPTSQDPDGTGWCLYKSTVPSYAEKVYLLVRNKTADDLVVDDAVVRPVPAGSPPPPPPPMEPPSAEEMQSHEEAVAAILALRKPNDPPPNPARRAFEEHLSR